MLNILLLYWILVLVRYFTITVIFSVFFSVYNINFPPQFQNITQFLVHFVTKNTKFSCFLYTLFQFPSFNHPSVFCKFLFQLLSVKALTKSLNAAPAPLVRAVSVPAREVKLTVGEKATPRRRCFQDSDINLVRNMLPCSCLVLLS